MEIARPITVEELQDANLLYAPKLLRGSMRARGRLMLHPSKTRTAIQGIAALAIVTAVLTDPRLAGPDRWGFLALLIMIFGYRLFFASRASYSGHEKRIRQMPRVLSVDADGLRFEDREKRLQFRPWTDYNKWREGDLVWVLKGPQRTRHIVPKRGLTQAQRDELRNLCEAVVPSRRGPTS